MLRNGEDFAIPRLKYQYLKSHPLFYFPNLWNIFKLVFKNSIVNRSTFSSNLKLYFLHKLDESCSLDFNCYFCTIYLLIICCLIVYSPGLFKLSWSDLHRTLAQIFTSSTFFFLLFTYNTPHKSKVFRDKDQTARYWTLRVSRHTVKA